MAQGNIIQGQASGKLGDIVLMNRKGKQVSRVYTTSGARAGDAASEAARIQRVRFGAASSEWRAYRYISTRMFRTGKKTKESDYNYFTKRNIDLLPYLTREDNMNNVQTVMPGLFSQGSYGQIDLLHTYVADDNDEGFMIATLYDQSHSNSTNSDWSFKVSETIEVLRIMYPNASKFTFAFLISSSYNSEDDGTGVVSQALEYETAILDSNNMSEADLNKKTNAWMAEQINNLGLSNIIKAQDGDIFNGQMLYAITAKTTQEQKILSSVQLLFFATNDNANDCYTTRISDTSIPLNTSAYSLWAQNRTEAAMNAAKNSYGYQSGVMKDVIAANGDGLAQTFSTYASKVSKLNKAAARYVAANSQVVDEIEQAKLDQIQASNKA